MFDRVLNLISDLLDAVNEVRLYGTASAAALACRHEAILREMESAWTEEFDAQPAEAGEEAA